MSQFDDAELARRSLLGYGETLIAFGCSAGEPIRRPDALGARLPQAPGSPWLDAAVVPFGVEPPAEDDPGLPHCLWTTASSAAARPEDPTVAMPCLGLPLADQRFDRATTSAEVTAPSFAELGELNSRAYGDPGILAGVLASVADPRARTYGLRVDGRLACGLMTLRVEDDVSIQYVATDPDHQRRGLASALMRAALAEARDDRMGSATLQASPDGLPVYLRLGFRQVAVLRAFRRPA